MNNPAPIEKNYNGEEEKSAKEETAKKGGLVNRRKILACLGAAFLLILILLSIILPLTLSRQDASIVNPEVSPSQSSLRLDRWLIPTKYDLHLKTYIPSDTTLGSGDGPIYPSKFNFTFDGNVSIFVECVKSIGSILLNAKRLNVSAENVRVFEMEDEVIIRKVPVSEVQMIPTKQQLRISLKEKLMEGKFYQISIVYRGEHGTDLSGFYRSSYVEKGVTR